MIFLMTSELVAVSSGQSTSQSFCPSPTLPKLSSDSQFVPALYYI